MDAYREMTHFNQVREEDALFAGIEVYDGEGPPHILKVGWTPSNKPAI